MSTPITWRNVEAPDLRGAAFMMGQAQAGINSGFERIQDILKAERATADANWNVVRDNNTQAFLDSVNQYRTADEFQAAQKSGALDQLRSQFGNQIDRAAVRAAEDGRLATLQGRDVQAINYGNTMQDHREAPTKQKVMADILAGKLKPEDLQQYSDNRFYLDASGKLREVTQQNTEWERAGTKFTREGEKHDSDMLTASAHRKVYAAQANNLNASATRERAESSASTTALKTALAESKAQKGAAELLIKNSPLDAGTMDTYAGQKAFEEGLGKLGLKPEQAKSVREQYAKQFANGVLVGHDDTGKEVRIGLPVSTALAGVRGSSDNWYTPNFLGVSNQGSSAVRRIREMIGEPTYVGSLQEALQAQGIQYRPLTTPTQEVPTARTLGIPKPTDVSMNDAAITQQAIQARAAKAKSQMTPEEINLARTTGRLPDRIKKMLERPE